MILRPKSMEALDKPPDKMLLIYNKKTNLLSLINFVGVDEDLWEVPDVPDSPSLGRTACFLTGLGTVVEMRKGKEVRQLDSTCVDIGVQFPTG